VADRVAPPRAIAAVIVAYVLLWVFLWGGTLARLSRADARGLRAFVRTGLGSFVPLLIVTLAALVVQTALFLVVHPLLFDTAADWVDFAAGTERAAFVGRLGLYAIFGSLLALTSVIVDFTRVHVVTSAKGSISAALVRTARLLRARPTAIVSLWLLAALVFGALLALYAAFDLRARGVPRVWSALVVGQLYIGGRIVARVLAAASQVHLVGRSNELATDRHA
jgi:hypothetical protein